MMPICQRIYFVILGAKESPRDEINIKKSHIESVVDKWDVYIDGDLFSKKGTECFYQLIIGIVLWTGEYSDLLSNI